MKKNLMSVKLLTTLAIFTLCVFNVSAHEPDVTTPHPEDEAAIRENVSQMEAGWNTKKGALFAKPFAEDADYVVINGMFLQGRAAIENAHQHIFNTVFKNTTLSLSIKQIRYLRSDVAVVHVSGHRSAAESEKELIEDAFMTMIMTRDKLGWRIAAFQNTAVTANKPR